MLNFNELNLAYKRSSYADIDEKTGAVEDAKIKNKLSTRSRLFISELQ